MADDTTRAPSSSDHIDFTAPVPTSPVDAGAAGAADGDAQAPAAGAATCSKCATPIGAYYYEAGGAIYCARCKRLAEESDAKGGRGGVAGFGRGAIYGVGAAILGAFGYWAFQKITGIDWALVSIGVGIFVATAIRKGNGGHGGRRFQVLAVALTYLAIGGAYAPFIIEGLKDAKPSSATSMSDGTPS